MVNPQIKFVNFNTLMLELICPETRSCYLIFRYLILFLFTILALLLWPTSNTSFWHQLSGLPGYGKQLLSSLFSATKEKNEDLNCEYEMMWDAEGSMHLVKKNLNTPIVTRSSDMNPERSGLSC